MNSPMTEGTRWEQFKKVLFTVRLLRYELKLNINRIENLMQTQYCLERNNTDL